MEDGPARTPYGEHRFAVTGASAKACEPFRSQQWETRPFSPGHEKDYPRRVRDSGRRNQRSWTAAIGLPVHLSPHVALPLPGILFRLHNRDLYVLRNDQNDRLLTASAQEIGNVWSMAALLCLWFLISGIVACFSARKFFRKYFVFGQLRPEEVEKAVGLGERTSIEFKRGISIENPNLEQILPTVAAFANTGDGTLFVGVDDDAKIKGIKIDNPKQKDQLAQKVH